MTERSELTVASSRRATVIVEQPTETLPGTDAAARLPRCGPAVNQFIREALAVPLKVLVLDELPDCLARMTGANGITRFKHSCVTFR
jgi:hypothetical protein